MLVRSMEEKDRSTVIAIYRQGVEEGNATFETMIHEQEWWTTLMQSERFVLEQAGKVIGWAKLGRVSERHVYHGVREVSIYLERSARGLGGGRFLLEALIIYADANGIWTLQSHMFPENIASRRLHERLGFELVGRRRAIAQHHGVWRDTLLLERRNDLR